MGNDKDIEKFEKLFSSSVNDGNIAVDPENIVESIDMEELDNEASATAVEMVTNLSKIYFNDQFMEDNPGLKRRIETFIESMRILIKMRKSSERTHDILVKAIPSQPTNASLYRSQAQIESNLLSIQKQMDDTVNAMTALLKNYQLELNFRSNSDGSDDDAEDSSVSTDTHRGSKTFIQQMQNKNSQQLDMFTGENNDEFTGEPIIDDNDEE